MIDPRNITKFDRTKSELEEFLLFCLIVAGKTAAVQACKLELFLNSHPFVSAKPTPFGLIKFYNKKGVLLERLQNVKMGQYNRLHKAFAEILKLNVFNCTVQDLESITGIGPKTARFYILHSRPNQQIAVLDTHILKWMRDELKLQTPKNTPNTKQYLILEKEFLDYCKKNKKDPATLDLEIWNKYSRS